jgi:hypothetical protein
VPQVKLWTQEHRRLNLLVAQITQLALALIRSHVAARRRQRGRS